MDYLPRNTVFTPGHALPWTEEDAELAMRTRLRVVGTPQAPNPYGLVGIAYHLVVLPTAPDGKETPIAATSCILCLN